MSSRRKQTQHPLLAGLTLEPRVEPLRQLPENATIEERRLLYDERLNALLQAVWSRALNGSKVASDIAVGIVREQIRLWGAMRPPQPDRPSNAINGARDILEAKIARLIRVEESETVTKLFPDDKSPALARNQAQGSASCELAGTAHNGGVSLGSPVSRSVPTNIWSS